MHSAAILFSCAITALGSYVTSVIAIHGETLLLQTHATRKTTVPEGELLKIMNLTNPGDMSLMVADYAATSVKDGVHLDDSTKDALGAMKTSLADESQKYITDAHGHNFYDGRHRQRTYSQDLPRRFES